MKKNIFNIPHSSYLYILKCGNYFKIGYSNRINDRLREIQSFNPFDINIVLLLDCENSNTSQFLENIIHDMYINKNHNKEWFILSKKDIYEILNYCVKYKFKNIWKHGNVKCIYFNIIN